MDKLSLNQQFASRLKDAMISAGHYSSRSNSGVCINKLSEITEYSSQICRKYLRGEVIPEPTKLIEISQKLNVSPGWLLFGEYNEQNNFSSEKKITISKNLLAHIFKSIKTLYEDHLGHEVSNFVLDLINDVSQIEADEPQLEKIVDLTLSSIKHFKKQNESNETNQSPEVGIEFEMV